MDVELSIIYNDIFKLFHNHVNFNKAMRTALTSIYKKEEVNGRNPVTLIEKLGDFIYVKDYSKLLSTLQSEGYKDEKDIITYSLFPSTYSLIGFNLLIYIDRATDDNANGDFVK